MQISFDVKEKIVGAFMVGVVILLLTIVVMIGRGKDWFRSYVTYYTVFDQAYNLNESSSTMRSESEWTLWLLSKVLP